MMATEPAYRDFDLSFKRHPLSNDISTFTDDAAIKNSLRNLLKLATYEKPFTPGIASPLYSLLFDPIDYSTATLMQVKLLVYIPQFETRITNLSIDVIPYPQDNKYEIDLKFTVKKTQSDQTLQLFLPVERLR